jgi:MoxR-like ATPase
VVLDCAGDLSTVGRDNSSNDADYAHQQLTRMIEGAHPAGSNGAAPELILPTVRKLQLSLEVADSPLSQAIQEAYVLSSRALLKILDARGLRSHMISLRRFFLLEHGDFFTQFMDAAEDELRREVKDVHLARVQGLLQMAVQTSTLVNDPHKEDLSCTLASHNLIQHLQLIQVILLRSAVRYILTPTNRILVLFASCRAPGRLMPTRMPVCRVRA